MKGVWKLPIAGLLMLALLVSGAGATTQDLAYEEYNISFDAGDGVEVGQPVVFFDPSMNATIWAAPVGINGTGFNDSNSSETFVIVADFDGGLDAETQDYVAFVKSELGHNGTAAEHPQTTPLVNGGCIGWAYFPDENLTTRAEAFAMPGSGDKIILVESDDNGELFYNVTRTLNVTGPGE